MKRARVALAIVLMAIGFPAAQGKDFSGKWVVDNDKTTAANAVKDQRYPTTEIVIAMDEKTMTVASKGPAGSQKNIFRVDGSTSSNNGVVSTKGARTPPPSTSTATWEGATLVITTKLYQGNGVLKYSMDGANLKVEYTSPGLPAPRVAIYKKA